MADIVNLNRYRKAREKQRACNEADENRIRHGRSKAEKISDRDERERGARMLDGAKRDDEGPEPA